MSSPTPQVSQLVRSRSYNQLPSQKLDGNTKRNSLSASPHLDLFLFSPKRSSRNQLHLAQMCDAFFNPKNLTLYESLLSAVMLKHKKLFIPILKQVFSLMQPGLEKARMHYYNKAIKQNIDDEKAFDDVLSEKMYAAFIQGHALPQLYGELVKEPVQFFDTMISDIASSEESTFFKKLAICRAYLTFYMGKGKLKPMGEMAIEKQWEKGFDIEVMINAVVGCRSQWFSNNLRKSRRQFTLDGIHSTNIGYLPPQDYDSLSEQDTRLLVGKVPEHEVGGYLYVITTKGDFTEQGSYTYQVPQLCGPSGMTAMYLGLANQANLNSEEKQLYSFIMSLYTVAFGGHTIDETFIMGSEAGELKFNNYVRGDYSSIIPTIVKESIEFADLYDDIRELDKRILHTDDVVQNTSNTISQVVK